MSAFRFISLCLLLTFSTLRAGETFFARPIPVPVDGSGLLLNEGRLVLAMNVGDGRQNVVTTVNGIPFQGGGRQGLSQTQTREGVTLRVVVDYAGQHDNRLVGLYPNDTPERMALFQLLNVGFISNAGRGNIEIYLSGLTPGRRYRLQSLHLWNTGGEGSREMILHASSTRSPHFQQVYRNGEIAGAVSMVTRFTPTAADFRMELSPKDYQRGIDRSYLNGLALFEEVP